jgi:hypothetical protein
MISINEDQINFMSERPGNIQGSAPMSLDHLLIRPRVELKIPPRVPRSLAHPLVFPGIHAVQSRPRNLKSCGCQKTGTGSQVAADFNQHCSRRLIEPKPVKQKSFMTGQVGIDLPYPSRVGPKEADKRGKQEKATGKMAGRDLQFLVGSL